MLKRGIDESTQVDMFDKKQMKEQEVYEMYIKTRQIVRLIFLALYIVSVVGGVIEHGFDVLVANAVIGLIGSLIAYFIIMFILVKIGRPAFSIFVGLRNFFVENK